MCKMLFEHEKFMLCNISRNLLCFIDAQALLERTGYTLDVTTGQRKYGGPPPESAHSGAQPTIGTEVYSFILHYLLGITVQA